MYGCLFLSHRVGEGAFIAPTRARLALRLSLSGVANANSPDPGPLPADCNRQLPPGPWSALRTGRPPHTARKRCTPTGCTGTSQTGRSASLLILGASYLDDAHRTGLAHSPQAVQPVFLSPDPPAGEPAPVTEGSGALLRILHRHRPLKKCCRVVFNPCTSRSKHIAYPTTA